MQKEIEELLPVLRNIEVLIKEYYHLHPDLTDAEVQEGLDELVRKYTALYRGVLYRPRPLGERAREILDREEDLVETTRELQELPLQKALMALKEIRASVKRHREKGNPRAYLEFIDKYVK